jgi:hypothetical protein
MIGQHFSIMRKSIWCFVQTWFPWLGFVLTASVFFAAASHICSQSARWAPDGGAFLGADLRPVSDRNARLGQASHRTARPESCRDQCRACSERPGRGLNDVGSDGIAAAENWTFNDDFVERLRYEIDPRWRGEIPRTLLITRDGSTRQHVGAPCDPDSICGA